MSSSRRLFWTGLGVFALGVAGCSSTTVPPGGTDGSTDGSKTDGAKTDGAKTDGASTSDAKDAGGPDLNVPPPTMLTATVLDRRATTFELLWTAPSIGGAAVTGYQVRYAKVPITTANFDDTTVTTAITYTGTPKAPGATDGMTVKLYIENAYYFAVEGANAAGTRSALDATSTAVTAHFNVTTLAGTSGLANEQFGIQLDGSGDLNGDGLSDILVGSTAGQQAYLFFGKTGTFSSSVPAVVFAGDATTMAFGRAVAIIGDIDKDGREDMAISDTASSPPRVFIYKGRATWPMTMSPSTADYVITGDATYDTSVFGISLARLGDFNGDGVDDFAIGASQYKNATNDVGRVVIVLGKTGFASITLPSTTSTITIDGDSTLTNPLFGLRVLGMGRLYSVTTGTTLIVSSPSVASSANASQGRLYAFHGQSGTAAAISLSSADNVFVGPSAGADVGNVLSNVGPMLNSLPSVASGNPLDTTSTSGISGSAFIFDGNSTSGPFASRLTLSQTSAAKSGQIIIGGSVSGRSVSYSFLGDSRPDLVLLSQTGTNIQIIDGNIVSALAAGPTDPTTIATATMALPADWSNAGQGEGDVVPDVNGDGYPDFAVANAINPVPGTVLVYW